jgi:NAD(P)-dependent dehydrogenase (short-subunit alcohol dehydrogenase family)
MTDDPFGLRGRVVVVAGAGGGGIGTAVCTTLGRAGARVVALDKDPARLELAERALAAANPTEGAGTHLAAVCDITRPDDVVAVIDRARDRLGPLHGLVHVAGGISLEQWAPTRQLTIDALRAVMELNLDAAITTTRIVAGHLRAQSSPGSMVLVASVAGLVASPYSASYGAAKAALISLMRTEAVEWGPFGIRVNAIAPGTIRTPRKLALGSTAQDTQDERDAIPLGRRGRPEEIAGAALFLVSDLAGFVSGQVLAVDGASSTKPSYLDPTGLPIFVRDPAMRERLR